jgi:hypothetical protein
MGRKKSDTVEHANTFVSTFAVFPNAQSQTKNSKRATNPTHNDTAMDRQITTEKEERRHNITYTQAGVSCFVGQESDKIKIQFFVGSSVVKIPACV